MNNTSIVSIASPLMFTKRFSNKRYSIQIGFHEHNMAVAEFTCKKKGYRSVRYGRVSFDECKLESMYDYLDCMDAMSMDKVARR